MHTCLRYLQLPSPPPTSAPCIRKAIRSEVWFPGRLANALLSMPDVTVYAGCERVSPINRLVLQGGVVTLDWHL